MDSQSPARGYAMGATMPAPSGHFNPVPGKTPISGQETIKVNTPPLLATTVQALNEIRSQFTETIDKLANRLDTAFAGLTGQDLNPTTHTIGGPAGPSEQDSLNHVLGELAVQLGRLQTQVNVLCNRL